ncbi:MAG: hypothetical protein R2748_30395 [Bryobacterales bacterium]
MLVSILLVEALPREAMSAQRVREERLIDRGQEYSRAIKLYFRENKKYPKDLDDLEDTNGVRYLRKRYKDPITGEDQWRLIHVGTDGRFKDSLIYDTEDPNEQNADGRICAGGSGFGRSSQMASNSANRNSRMDANTYQQLYGTPPPAQPGVFAGADIARQTRDSAAPDNPLQQQHMQFTMDAAQQQGGEVANAENAGLDEDGRPLPADQQQPTDYSNVPPGQVPIDAGQVIPGQQQQPQMPSSGLRASRGSISSRGASGQRPQPGFAQAAMAAGGAGGAAAGGVGVSGDAASMIGRLLTTPRPGGLAGIQGMAGQQQNAMGGAQFEEGIAGVASKAEQYGVKVYKGKSNYNEWEFVYDYRQDGQQGGMGAAPAAGAGNINPNQPGLTAGGGLSGVPGGALPGQLPVVAPTTGQDPRMSQFGGTSATPRLPSTGATNPDAQRQRQQDQDQQQRDPYDPNAPQDPNSPYPQPPIEAEPPPPTTQTPTTQSPGRSYQLPRSRSGARQTQAPQTQPQQ